MTSGLAHITTELPQILRGLDAAYPGLVVYGMNYYDPFLGLWLTGQSGQTLAQQSESLAVTLNALLELLAPARIVRQAHYVSEGPWPSGQNRKAFLHSLMSAAVSSGEHRASRGYASEDGRTDGTTELYGCRVEGIQPMH